MQNNPSKSPVCFVNAEPAAAPRSEHKFQNNGLFKWHLARTKILQLNILDNESATGQQSASLSSTEDIGLAHQHMRQRIWKELTEAQRIPEGIFADLFNSFLRLGKHHTLSRADIQREPLSRCGNC